MEKKQTSGTMAATLKHWLPDVVAVVVFAIIALVYFYPADFEGRILYQHDTSAGVGAGQEASEYLQRTGERTRWTNSLFSGMPTYQLAPSYSSTDTVVAVEKAYHLWLPDAVWYLFAYLLGFYILLRAFDFRWHLAALGSVLWAFSTYFLIIIAAGHLWKVMALAYLPPMIAGLVLAYQREKYLPALAVTALFAALEIHANHIQMTYYYLIIIIAMVVGWLVEAIRTKRMAHFMKATAVCAIGGILGVLVNLSNIYHTWQYSQQTMRGGSELVSADGSKATGLDRDYITQWSYGIGETWTLLIPNAKGGSHNEQLKNFDGAMKASDPRMKDFCGQWYPYFGEQPFTAGPVYVGAFVVMLFVLGLFIVKGPVKWALLAATVLSILLSWGKNFMGLTDFFIDYVPMYAKFRTVSSILVVAEFCIPLLAIMALKRFIEGTGANAPIGANASERLNNKSSHLSPLTSYLYIAFALTAGICLLFALSPTTFFNFITEGDHARLSQYVDGDMLTPVLANIAKMRAAVFTADCWRSLLVILIGTVLLLLYRANKLKAIPTVGLIAVLCLVELWQVNKRYLNDSMFREPSIRQTAHAIKPVNQMILQDKDPDYRVLNFSTDTFNENETSYYHKSVGGYHAAKLGRYNDLISAYIIPEMQRTAHALQQSGGRLDSVAGGTLWPVINMLNTRYFIFSDQMALPNPYANGNAWFVDGVRYVGNANEELASLASLDLRHEAVADEKFKDVLGDASAVDSTAVVALTSYEPNELHYTVESQKGGVVVFSEIFYPGWTATIDGQEAEIGRVNYVLRALRIDGGHHDVVLTFKPQSVRNTETIAFISLAIIAIIIVAVIAMSVMRRKKK